MVGVNGFSGGVCLVGGELYLVGGAMEDSSDFVTFINFPSIKK